MTTESKIEILRAHLSREGLTIVQAAGCLPVDGMAEFDALRSIVDVLEDADAVAEWEDASTKKTRELPMEVLVALSRAA